MPGHEDPNEVAVHMELAKSLRASDYPALLWLLGASAYGHGIKVFDFGGNVGNLFYSYSPYLNRSGPIDWTVLDIPPVLERGRKIAAERNAEGLRFASSAAEFRDDQVLLVSGALHYWEGPIAEFLEQFPVLPRHIIVNRSPVSEKEEPFVVVQRTATCAFPCVVRNADGMLAEFAAEGYTLVDRWAASELRLSLPLFPEHSVPHYSGFYLRHQRV